MLIDANRVNLLEKDLEDFIFKCPNILSGHEEGLFKVKKWIGRQYRVPSGIIDLLAINEYGHVLIIELKNVPFDASHLTQLSRYASDIDEAYSYEDTPTPIIIKLLVGIKEPPLKLLTEANSLGIHIKTFEFNTEIRVSNRWVLNDEYYNKRDTCLKNLFFRINNELKLAEAGKQ